VPDVATDELDIRLLRRSVKEKGRDLAKSQALGSGYAVVSIDDDMVVAGDEDRGPTPLQLGQGGHVSLVETALTKVGLHLKRLETHNRRLPHHGYPSLWAIARIRALS
jgi:hypothetical protein